MYGVLPALHGYDVPNTFYNGPNASPLQQWAADFATGGSPFSGRSILLSDNGTQAIDDKESGNCKWWQDQF